MGTIYTSVRIDTEVEAEVHLDESELLEMLSEDGVGFEDLLGYGTIDEDDIIAHLSEAAQSMPCTYKDYVRALTGSDDVKGELEELKESFEALKTALNESVMERNKLRTALKDAVMILNAITAMSDGPGYYEINRLVNDSLIKESTEPSLEGMHLVDEDDEDNAILERLTRPNDEPPTTFKSAYELDNEGGA